MHARMLLRGIASLGFALVSCSGAVDRAAQETGAAESARTVLPAPPRTGTPARLLGRFTLVGHDPLSGRGMNAAIAIAGDYAYVGSRTDGSEGHPHPGVLIVNIADPQRPKVAGEIGAPDAGNPGETSRELRAWPSQDLLISLNFPCSPAIHDCLSERPPPTVRFFDIRGVRAARPRLIATYRPSREPHEFFLWQDPRDENRALLYLSTPDTGGSLLVADISGARAGRIEETASWTTTFPDPGPDDELHSLSVSPNGRRAYLAHLTAGFFVLDTSEVAAGREGPRIRVITDLARRPQWPGPGAHSAVKIPGRPLVLTTDEVYGRSERGGGCPWGWARLIDVANEKAPRVRAEMRALPVNDVASCAGIRPASDRNASFSSHNPTVTRNLALVTWHSAGLRAFSIEDPDRPVDVAAYLPTPLRSVATEDPALSSGPEKVVMWSYPIVRDGLIYVVDIRNGLYILRYRGPHAEEVSGARFLEGNSNLGDGRGA